MIIEKELSKISKKIFSSMRVGKHYSASDGELYHLIEKYESELNEIFSAYSAWANAQNRFTDKQSFAGGTLYIGDTNVWISTDGDYVRIVLTQELEVFNEIFSQINSF